MTTYAGDFLGLPGLRAYWPMNAFDASGNAIDQAGLDLVLTYNGNPGYNVTAQGAGYLDLDGTGDFLSRVDEASLDIIGTESHVASAQRGLTIGGWFWADVLSGTQALIAKTGSVTTVAFDLIFSVTAARMEVASAGSGYTASSAALSVSTWYFIAGRYVPSTSVDVFVYTTKVSNTTSIPASITNSDGPFQIGSYSGLLNGRVSNCFMCAMALSDTAISNLYNNTKAAYGL